MIKSRRENPDSATNKYQTIKKKKEMPMDKSMLSLFEVKTIQSIHINTLMKLINIAVKVHMFQNIPTS